MDIDSLMNDAMKAKRSEVFSRLQASREARNDKKAARSAATGTEEKADVFWAEFQPAIDGP